MRKFLSKIALFSLLLFLVLNIISILAINYSPGKEFDNRLELVLQGQMNNDIIILGSSRAARNIMAGQLAEETRHSTYNLSYPGTNIEFHEFILRTLLQFNSTPEMVILSVDDSVEFLQTDYLNFRLDRLYPLIKYPYIVQELINREEKNKLMAQLFPFYLVNRSNFNLKQKKPLAIDSIKNSGSMPFSFQKSTFNYHYEDGRPKGYDRKNEVPEKIIAFKEIIATCKAKNIQLLIVFPPNFYRYNEAFENRLKQLSNEGILYFTYDKTNSIYKDSNYFNDHTHLMQNGAMIFTHELANYIKSYGKLNHSVKK